jgi:hypothetical protein
MVGGIYAVEPYIYTSIITRKQLQAIQESLETSPGSTNTDHENNSSSIAFEDVIIIPFNTVDNICGLWNGL